MSDNIAAEIAASNAAQSTFYAENDRTIPAGPDEEQVEVTLVIDNIYEDGDEIRTTVRTTIAAPPYPLVPDFDSSSDEFCEWEQDEIFQHTGTGKTEGDASYFVEVTESDRPDLIPVGTEFEFC